MKFEGSIDFFELKIKELHVNLMGNLQNIKQTMGMLSRMIYKGGAGRNMPLPKIIWAFPTIQYTIKLTILRSAPTIVALRGLILPSPFPNCYRHSYAPCCLQLQKIKKTALIRKLIYIFKIPLFRKSYAINFIMIPTFRVSWRALW
jgi:hypothetical protein